MVTSALTKSLQKKGVVSGPPTQLRLNATSRPLFDRHPTPAPLAISSPSVSALVSWTRVATRVFPPSPNPVAFCCSLLARP
jgi:hypothetical protein